jgi:hypothetical protein
MQHRELWADRDLSGARAQTESSPQHRQLVVDGRVCCTLCLPMHLVCGESVRRQLDRADLAEELPQVLNRVLDSIDTAPTVGAIIVAQHLGEFIECRSIDLRTNGLARLHVADSLLQQPYGDRAIGRRRRLAHTLAVDIELNSPNPAALRYATETSCSFHRLSPSRLSGVFR